jgi:hypothetical protein
LSRGGNTFFDNTNASVYSLDLANHKATLESTGKLTRPDNMQAGNAKPLSEEWIGGIRSQVFPLQMRVMGGQLFQAGQVCTAPDYGLLVKRDMTYPSADGRTEHVVWTMQGVEIGKEPDRKLFDAIRSGNV